jgi:hypothetical protein
MNSSKIVQYIAGIFIAREATSTKFILGVLAGGYLVHMYQLGPYIDQFENHMLETDGYNYIISLFNA